MEAGLFKPATDIGLWKAVCELLNTLVEDWFNLRSVPRDLGPYPAIFKEGENHVQVVQVAVELAVGNHLGEVVDFFSQYLFGDVFVVGLVSMDGVNESVGQEECHAKCSLVFADCDDGGKWGLTCE